MSVYEDTGIMKVKKDRAGDWYMIFSEQLLVNYILTNNIFRVTWYIAVKGGRR